MRYLVAAIAVLLLLISALGVIAPERVVAFVTGWSSDTRLSVAVGARVLIGAVFIAGAAQCRVPSLIYGLGTLALMAALFFLVMGEPRLDALIGWWSRQSPFHLRGWFLLMASVGALILYAASPRVPGSDPE